MSMRRAGFMAVMFVLLEFAVGNSARPQTQDGVETAKIRASNEQFVAAFNAGKAGDVAAMFLLKGELIDEHGRAYQGQEEIKDLHAKYFEKFPGAKLILIIESIRLVGPVAIEEGT